MLTRCCCCYYYHYLLRQSRANTVEHADLFQLWDVLARLDAFVEQRYKNSLKVLKWCAVVNALRVSHYVDEK